MNTVIEEEVLEVKRKLPGLRAREIYIGLYLEEIRKVLNDVCVNSLPAIEEFAQILGRARVLQNSIMFFGMEQDYHIINHANVDFLKINNLNVISMGIPEITAFGNDFPFPDQLKEILERRHFGKKDILVGVQFDENNRLLQKAFEYNSHNGGINVLLSNSNEVTEYTGINIFINSKNTFIARDIAQIILHFLSINIELEANAQFRDRGARSFPEYCSLLVESLKGPYFSSTNLAGVSDIIEKKLKDGSHIFTFGNGGSAAIASFVSDALRALSEENTNSYTKIFDVTSFVGNVTKSINDGNFKKDAFTKIINSLGVKEGDLLLGISSSGNSENVLHPLSTLIETVRVGILGFGDGGVIGTSQIADSLIIVADAGRFKSYQRAEDGQRIAMSAIINSIINMGVG